MGTDGLVASKKRKEKGENAMSYSKPEVIALGGALLAIRCACPKNIYMYLEALTYNAFSATAYEADE